MEPIPTIKKTDDQAEVAALLQRNAELLEDNNKMLKSIKTHMWWSLGIRLAWYAVLIGLPFLIYFYLIGPYFELFGADYELFRAGIGELPGLKSVELIYPQE